MIMTMATIFGSQRWSLYTGLTVFTTLNVLTCGKEIYAKRGNHAHLDHDTVTSLSGVPKWHGNLFGGRVVLHGALAVENVAGVVILLTFWNVGRGGQELMEKTSLRKHNPGFLVIRGRYVPSFWTANLIFAYKKSFLSFWAIFADVNMRVHRF